MDVCVCMSHLTASTVVRQPDCNEGACLILAKLGQIGQHISQRNLSGQKLQFFTIKKLKLQFKPCISMNQNFFFYGLKGGLKLFTNKQKNFGSGPILILHGH